MASSSSPDPQTSTPASSIIIDRRSQTEISYSYLLDLLHKWVANLPHIMKRAKMSGENSKTLALPLDDSINEQSWNALIYYLVNLLSTSCAPCDEESCWFLSTDQLQYVFFSPNHQSYSSTLPEILKLLAIGQPSLPPGHFLVHRCHAIMNPHVRCVNPAHISITMQYPLAGLDLPVCYPGCQRLCDHQPKCIWSRLKDGRRLKCLEDWVTVCDGVCVCGTGCFELVSSSDLVGFFDAGNIRLTMLKAELAKRDSHLAELKSELAKERAQLAEREAIVTKREVQIKARESQLVENQAEMTNREGRLREREAQIIRMGIQTPMDEVLHMGEEQSYLNYLNE